MKCGNSRLLCELRRRTFDVKCHEPHYVFITQATVQNNLANCMIICQWSSPRDPERWTPAGIVSKLRNGCVVRSICYGSVGVVDTLWDGSLQLHITLSWCSTCLICAVWWKVWNYSKSLSLLRKTTWSHATLLLDLQPNIFIHVNSIVYG